MSEIKPADIVADSAIDPGEEKDWAAAKAFFDNLKTKTPRPVSILVSLAEQEDSLNAACFVIIS